jgi:hypothetical protein
MRLVAIVLLATGIAGPVSALPASQACSAIEVTAPGLRKQPRGLRFSTRQILDLEFETRLERPVYGDHLLRFKVLTPNGFLYQELTAPFSWRKPHDGRGPQENPKAAATLTARAVPGFASALPVQQLGVMSHGRPRDSVRARLPVAGTSITMSTLYGRWTVQAFLDDRERPCSAPRPFTIRDE